MSVEVEQPTLFEGLVRRGDPETAKHAARVNITAKLTQRRRILEAFVEYGPMIHEELGRVPGVHDTAHRTRCRELQQAGMIEDTEARRPTAAGAESIVWAITDAGRAALRAADNA